MSEYLEQEYDRLVRDLQRLQHAYYVEQTSLVSDREYDRLFDRLIELEQAHPELKRSDSPSLRVGSDLSGELPETEHTIPVLSLDKAYSLPDLQGWMDRTARRAGRHLSFAAEEKIDGAAIVLYYREGVLDRAVTRGNGFAGNDVTGNVRTIRQVPLRLTEPVTIAVRGEIFLAKSDFEKIAREGETVYANPRNLAAGSLRRVKSSETARVPLQLCVYEGYPEGFALDTHDEMLRYLSRLGLPLSRYIALFSQEPVSRREWDDQGFSHWSRLDTGKMEEYIRELTEARSQRDYEIDGLVFKVNELDVREQLGYTGHHPRWALAFKFESPEAETVINAIEVQIGRTGRVTPVARVEPVQIGGSVVSNVTLHNQDYIRVLEAAEGDRVAISKRGDVIPAVERVIDKQPDAAPHWELPKQCPSCSAFLEQRGAHHFCPNPACPDQVFGRIRFFCARQQMDIDGVGPETIRTLIELGVLKDTADLYELPYDRVLSGVAGFGEKKINAVTASIEKSKERPFVQVLASLGIGEIGKKASQLLVNHGYGDIELLLDLAQRHEEQQLCEIKGFGVSMAASLGEALRNPEMVKRIRRLSQSGLQFSQSRRESASGIFTAQTWCVTGSFEAFTPRTRAEELIEQQGGKVVSAVSKQVTHLLAGKKAGSKLEKARELGAEIVDEQTFLSLLEQRN